MRSGVSIVLLTWAMWAAGAAASAASPASPDLMGTIPRDAWVVIAVADGRSTTQPTEASQVGSPFETATFLLDQARRMGLAAPTDLGTRVVMDAVTSWPVVKQRSFAVCLLSADAVSHGRDGYRLASLQAGLIVHTAGRNADLEARVRHLLSSYVNSETATIDPVGDGKTTSYRLIDHRLPGWARFQWGPVGEFYVVAIGPAAFEQIAATIRGDRPSLRDNPWFAQAHARCRGDKAVVQWTVRFDRIRQHLEPVMAGRPDAVIDAIGLGDVERGLWAIGSTGRAVEAYAVLRSNHGDEFAPICVVPDDTAVVMAIPPQATRYAAIDYSPGRLVLRARDAYLASRSPSNRENLRNLWAQVEAETGVSVNRDLLSQLGRWIVIHDHPPNPLSLPLARTVLVEIGGSPLAVRTTIDRLLTHYQQYLNAARGGSPGWLDWQLKRAPDGVWYLQAGIYGPALTVTDRWIVIGHSPVAVRSACGGADFQRLPGRPTLPPGRTQPAP